MTDITRPTLVWNTASAPSVDAAPTDAPAPPLLPPVPDQAAAELLESPSDPAAVPPPDAMPAAGAPATTFEQALANGLIPTFEDQTADIAIVTNAPPLDPDAERAAYLELLAFIDKNKDPGTTVTAMSADAFLRGLA